MPRTLIVALTTSVSQQAPGTIPGGMVITLQGSPGSPTILPHTLPPTAPYSTTFQNVPADTYTATAQAIDSTGNPLGPSFTSAATIVTDLPVSVSVDVPIGITISVD